MLGYWLAEPLQKIYINPDYNEPDAFKYYNIKEDFQIETDFYKSNIFETLFVSEKAKSWLEKNFKDQFEFFLIY